MNSQQRAFLESVDRTHSGCWLWKGTISSRGYGQTKSHSGERLAHRMAYNLFVGHIPMGMQIDHLCRVRNCVNPEHLEVVTGRENQLRGFAARRQEALTCKEFSR